MLKKIQRMQEQWQGSSEVIDQWLNARQNLIIEYCKLADLRPTSHKHRMERLPSREEIHTFSQHLVDYISVGHFKIYEMVHQHWRLQHFVATPEIKEAYSNATLTTEPLLNFADKYAGIEDQNVLREFDDDLSLIGEILEVRFELEDLLFELISDSLLIVS